MSREGDLMRKALRRHLVPALQQLGFTGTPSTFRRAGDGWIDLLSVQHWKYGGEFILEFARRGERGPLHTSWGETVPEEKLDVAYLDPMQRARLQQRSFVASAADGGFGGFRFQGFGEDPRAYDALAGEVVALLPQVDAWLQTRRAGSHVHAFQAGAADAAAPA